MGSRVWRRAVGGVFVTCSDSLGDSRSAGVEEQGLPALESQLPVMVGLIGRWPLNTLIRQGGSVSRGEACRVGVGPFGGRCGLSTWPRPGPHLPQEAYAGGVHADAGR